MRISRTTVRLDEELLRAARKRAAETGRTLSSLIEDALREVLARKSPKIDTAKFDPPVFRGGTGTLPGVDLSNTADLLDRMEDFKPR